MLRWALLPIPFALAALSPFACATGDRSLEESSEATSGSGGQGGAVAAASSSATGGVGGAGGATSTATGAGGGHPDPDAGDDGPVEAGEQPDLIADAITRDASYYYVEFCNIGSAGSAVKFTVTIENVGSGQSFESNPIYPF